MQFLKNIYDWMNYRAVWWVMLEKATGVMLTKAHIWLSWKGHQRTAIPLTWRCCWLICRITGIYANQCYFWQIEVIIGDKLEMKFWSQPKQLPWQHGVPIFTATLQGSTTDAWHLASLLYSSSSSTMPLNWLSHWTKWHWRELINVHVTVQFLVLRSVVARF